MKRGILKWMCLWMLIPLTGTFASAGQEKRHETLDQWNEQIEKIHDRLQAGEWANAERSSKALADEMAQRLLSGGNSNQVLALVATYQAVAYAGLEQPDSALWYWQVAQNLKPDLRRGARFPEYGTAGAFLEARSLRQAGEAPKDPPLTLGHPGDDDFSRPGPLFVPPPPVPPGLALEGWHEDRMRIEVVVDAGGQIRAPVVLEGTMPSKIYLGLEALRQWRLEPARSAGQQVPSLLTLTEFTVPGSFAFTMAENRDLREINELLMTRRWHKASTATTKKINESLRSGTTRPQGRSLGLLTTLRALAEAGLGKNQEALWHWYMAQAFYEGIGQFDFSAYGPVGDLLEQNKARCGHVSRAGCDAMDLSDVHGPFQPPRPIDSPTVSLPPELLSPLESERIIVRAVAGTDGRLRDPMILAGHSERTVYSALETMANWSFEPAIVDGEPTAVVYELTVPLTADVAAEEVGGWRRRLDEVDARLRASEGPEPLSAARDLVTEIAGRIGRGGSDLLGRALTLLALAEAGRGHEDVAVWHWHVAQNLAREIRYHPLEPYGPAGDLLARQPLRGSGRKQPATRPIAAPEPQLPQADLPDLAVVEVLVDAEGRPSSPLVFRGRAPGHLFAALEALRQWRFEPGEQEAGPAPREVVIPLARLRSKRDVKAIADQLSEVSARWRQARWEKGTQFLTRALEEAGRGEVKEALGHWGTSQIFIPELALKDFSKDGEAGQLLAEHRRPMRSTWIWRSPTQSTRKAGVAAAMPPSAAGPLHVVGDVEKPVKISGPQPQYTNPARVARLQGVVIVQAVIDRYGFVRDLKLLKGLPMGLSEQSLRAIYGWRFLPATLNGTPVDVYYNLTVNFRLQ